MLPAVDVCKKCNQSKVGSSHQFHFGTRTGQTSSRSGRMTTTTTTYTVLGSKWVHICDDCMRKMTLTHGLGWLIFGILFGLAGYGFDRLLSSGGHFVPPYSILCGITGFIVVISNLVFLLKLGNENFKEKMAIKLSKQEIRKSSSANTFWTTKDFGKLNISRF
jgi:hypothetical protein